VSCLLAQSEDQQRLLGQDCYFYAYLLHCAMAMLGLGRLLQARDHDGDHDGEKQDRLVDSLLQRVSESALLEDRREALLQLKDLVTESVPAQNAFSSLAYPIACSVLREDREDLDMLRAAVECINAATTQDGRRSKQVRAASVTPTTPAATAAADTALLQPLRLLNQVSPDSSRKCRRPPPMPSS